MDEGLLSNARPISCSDCPAFQRRHSSLFCTAESPNRLPGLMPHHLWRENLYQMVLHRPIETTAFTVHVEFQVSDYPTTQEFRPQTECTCAKPETGADDGPDADTSTPPIPREPAARKRSVDASCMPQGHRERK